MEVGTQLHAPHLDEVEVLYCHMTHQLDFILQMITLYTH